MDKLEKMTIGAAAVENPAVAEHLVMAMIDTMDMEDLQEVFRNYTLNATIRAMELKPDLLGQATAGCACLKCIAIRHVNPDAPEKETNVAGLRLN